MKEYFTLKSSRLSDLEDMFAMYPDIERLIAIRKYEILAERPEGELVGGRSNVPSNPTERQAFENMKLEEDVFITYHRRIQEAIERTLCEMDDKTRAIVHEKFYSGNGYEWDDVGRMQEPKMSHTTIYRKRKSILTHLAKNVGMI